MYPATHLTRPCFWMLELDCPKVTPLFLDNLHKQKMLAEYAGEEYNRLTFPEE